MNPFSIEGGASGLWSWSSKSLMLGVVLLIVAVVPAAWFPFALLKSLLFVFFLLVAGLLYIAASIKQGALIIPRSALFWAILLLPAVYAIAAYFSQNPQLSWVGNGGSVATVLFVAICALASALVALVVRSASAGRAILMCITCALTLAVLFQAANLFFGPEVFGLSVFSALSSNLIGKWNDFGILAGLLGLLSMIMIDIGRPSSKSKILYGVLLAISLATLAVVNLDVAWQVLAGSAIVIGISVLMGMRNADPMTAQRREVPYASVAVLVISVVFIAWGTAINAGITKIIPVSELEVRPSASLTLDIIKSTYGEGAKKMIVGSGPATFVEQWLVYKPNEVNASQFWNLDFEGGSGTITTALVSVGLLGGFAWLLIILLLVFLLLRAIRRPLSDPMLQGMLIASATGSLYLMAASVLYLTGQVVLIIAFVLMGLTIALEVLGRGRERVLPLRASGAAVLGGYGVLAVLLLVSLVSTAFTYQRFMSNLYVGKALSAGSAGDIGKAEAQAMKALSIHKNEETLRLLANIKFSQAQQIAGENVSEANAPAKAQQFQAAFADAVKYGQEAAAINPRNYQNWNLLGQMFEPLIELKVQGAYDNAKLNYLEAAKRNPRNPGIFLSAARMEAQGGNEAGFKDAIQRAFALKPNYTDAALLVVQVEVARNNIDGAISAAEVAASTAPGSAGVFFQLGLLKYTKGDNNGAREALEKAVAIVPDYANAKYFLGLTYYRLQNLQGSIQQFQDIQQTNAENAEIKLILSNLQSGKDPFAGAVPPVTPNPETRQTAPIEE